MCGKMATNTTNDEKYSRLVLMLVKGGTKITKALFEKRFKAMTPEDHDPSPWTIDEFLQANKKKILSNQTGRAKKQMFFPFASGTEIDLWDLYMFCFVLVDVCGVSIAIRMDIDQLKKIRNKLCHLSKPSVDTPMYEKNVLKIKYSFDRLLAEIDDKLLTEEIAKVIQAAKEEPLSHQDTISVLHAFSKMEEETREMLSQHSKDITEIRGKMIEMEKKVDLILKNQKPNQTETVKVPEIIIELLVKNCDSDNEVIISKLLVDMYKEVTGRSSSDKHSKEEYSKMMAAVRDIVDRFTTKDRSIVDAEQGCIIFRIRCSSVASLVSLFDDCIAGNLNKEFKPLEACIREIKGCEEVTLEPVIFEDEFWKTISQTISSLEEMISRLYNTEFQSSVGNQNNAISSISDVNLVERLSPTTEDEKRIHHAVRLTIRTDQNGKEQLKESVKNGSFDSSINRLREEVVDHYDLTKLSIEARVVDEESQCFAGADQVLVIIQSNEFTNNYKEDNLKEDTRVSWKINVGTVSKEHEDEYEKNVSRDSDIAIHASPVEKPEKKSNILIYHYKADKLERFVFGAYLRTFKDKRIDGTANYRHFLEDIEPGGPAEDMKIYNNDELVLLADEYVPKLNHNEVLERFKAVKVDDITRFKLVRRRVEATKKWEWIETSAILAPDKDVENYIGYQRCTWSSISSASPSTASQASKSSGFTSYGLTGEDTDIDDSDTCLKN